MINIRTLKKLANNDGLTLKNGKTINYKSGWQVATEGIETTDIVEAMKAVRAYNGNCGVWFSEGIWYIDKAVECQPNVKLLSLVELVIRFRFLNGQQWNWFTVNQ